MIRVLIIEDELLVAQTLEVILENNGYSVVGMATSLEECKKLISANPLDVALCDIYLNGEDAGIQIAAYLGEQLPAIPVIFLSAFADKKTIANASATQPVAYLVKPYTEKQVLATLQIVLNSKVIDDTKSVPKPTAREAEVLIWLAKGYSSKQIAQTLNLSEHTIQTHRKNMMNRYETTSSSELIALAIKQKWIKLAD
jgi:DNA-binding NarL/FixJ family response regulator